MCVLADFIAVWPALGSATLTVPKCLDVSVFHLEQAISELTSPATPTTGQFPKQVGPLLSGVSNVIKKLIIHTSRNGWTAYVRPYARQMCELISELLDIMLIGRAKRLLFVGLNAEILTDTYLALHPNIPKDTLLPMHPRAYKRLAECINTSPGFSLYIELAEYADLARRCMSPDCTRKHGQPGIVLQKCSGCGMMYCSLECQHSAWKHAEIAHKAICRDLPQIMQVS
jgi:hypothetical protein